MNQLHSFDPATVNGFTVSSANIVVELRQAILRGDLVFGQKLPPERLLALQFGASRNTVREALRQLEENDLVSRRVGSGTYVIYRDTNDRDDAADATSPLELIEVRFAVEPNMTRLAVQNAGARDLERLEEALINLEKAGDDPKRFSRADEAFHLCLAECSRNPLMAWLYKQVNEVRGNTLWFEAREKILTPARIAEYNREHRQLYEAIRRREMDNALSLINDHLNDARTDLIGANGES
ncbi:MAG: FadR family transcriptional regulator [Rhodospirillales bacterium]|nr:FadR family transcriptional regulator [Rhodospirillales bacterium]